MPHKVEDFLESDAFFAAMLHCAGEMLAIYHESPRIASIFAAQQRWLMAHAGFALHFGVPGEQKPGLYSGRFIAFVVENKIASRNTAAAFIQEMIAYRFLRVVEGTADKRTRLLEPTDTAQEHFVKWLATHLLILDHLDSGGRYDRAVAETAAFSRMQPLIAKRILDSDAVRNPGATYNLFNWANSGGLVMDYLMSRITEFDKSIEQVNLGKVSLKEIRDRFMISNTHLKRLFTQAAEVGDIGWTEASFKGDMWLSRKFVLEYWGYQAAKFVVVDGVAEEVLGLAIGKIASRR
ncbi:hypothetical protein ASE04_13365 [Rhizobium sp. Root708]|uniref:hypothetical protein n=1 Tax=Rhizobium sp. Root708 TaxID=1736592 RepID=UPI0006F1FBBA|nr:hypothetical protein [Rhizobium sp. Root708]KRB50902.1 hypothetical protein ASE04_13365 [Rhizobium sp. Root708]